MKTLTVTAKGQVTLKKELLRHFGVSPGQQIEMHKLADGQLVVRAARPAGAIDAFIGLLSRETDRGATIDEINAAAAQGWAGHE